MIKEYNPSMHNFNVAIVDCRYLFRLLENNHHQTVYQTYKKEIILRIDSRRGLYTSSVQSDDVFFWSSRNMQLQSTIAI